MNRRQLLQAMLFAPIVGAPAPTRRVYSFLWGNPLARANRYDLSDVVVTFDGKQIPTESWLIHGATTITSRHLLEEEQRRPIVFTAGTMVTQGALVIPGLGNEVT